MTANSPTSANYPQLILDLLTHVMDNGEITLTFPTASECWTTRKQIYGLRKALVHEVHPRRFELEGISVSHLRDTNTLIVRNLETASTGLSVISRALHGMPPAPNTQKLRAPIVPVAENQPPENPTSPLDALLASKLGASIK